MTVHWSELNIFTDCMMYGFKLPSLADVSLERSGEGRGGGGLLFNSNTMPVGVTVTVFMSQE